MYYTSSCNNVWIHSNFLILFLSLFFFFSVFQVYFPRWSGHCHRQGQLRHELPLLCYVCPGHPGTNILDTIPQWILLLISVSFDVSPVSRIWSWQQRGLHWDVPDYDQKRGHHCAGTIWSVLHGCCFKQSESEMCLCALHTDHIMLHLIVSFREKTFPATVFMWWWWWKQKMRLVVDPCGSTLSVRMSWSMLAIAPRSSTSWFLLLLTVSPA